METDYFILYLKLKRKRINTLIDLSVFETRKCHEMRHYTNTENYIIFKKLNIFTEIFILSKTQNSTVLNFECTLSQSFQNFNASFHTLCKCSATKIFIPYGNLIMIVLTVTVSYRQQYRWQKMALSHTNNLCIQPENNYSSIYVKEHKRRQTLT